MKRILSLVIIAYCCTQLMAAKLIITPHSGATLTQDIHTIGKWVFVDNDLQLLDKEGNLLARETVAEIRKITFFHSATAVEDALVTDILIYPNPTHDILIIKGIENQSLRVYDLQGKMILHEHGTEVHVSHLATGTYLLQIGTQVVRFIKQ